MRKWAISTALSMLLGGCASAPTPQAEVSPEPQPAPEAQAPAPPVQIAPRAAAPRRAAEARIDNTSLESFRESWQQLRASLSPQQQTDLNAAVARLAFAPYGGSANLPRNLRDSPIVPEIVRARIAGMSYAEIIELSSAASL